jgi:histidinol-phosphate aminotransferase
MYRLSTLINRGKVVEVPRDDEFAINIDEVKAAITPKTKLIIIANPNAPTGIPSSREQLIGLAETGTPLLVDEAYYEFYGHTVVDLLNKYDNLMILRTFSKWAGLAGLRIGYGIFPSKIAGYLMRIKPPYNVNSAALTAAIETLKDIDYLMTNVKKIIAERDRFSKELEKITWLKPIPSQANFILCQVLQGNAREIQQNLQSKGIVIRCINQPPRLPNCLRIGVGKPEETNVLLSELHKLGDK